MSAPVKLNQRKLANQRPAADRPWPFLGLAGLFLTVPDHVPYASEPLRWGIFPQIHSGFDASGPSLMWPVLQECHCSACDSAKALVCQGLPQMCLCHNIFTDLCVAIAMNLSQVLVTHIQDHLPLLVFLNTNSAPAP